MHYDKFPFHIHHGMTLSSMSICQFIIVPRLIPYIIFDLKNLFQGDSKGKLKLYWRIHRSGHKIKERKARTN